MEWDKYEFRIAGHFLSALINGDQSGLNSTESAEFDAWESGVRENIREGFTPGHWSCDSDDSDDWGRCAITGLFAMRASVSFHIYRKGAAACSK